MIVTMMMMMSIESISDRLCRHRRRRELRAKVERCKGKATIGSANFDDSNFVRR